VKIEGAKKKAERLAVVWKKVIFVISSVELCVQEKRVRKKATSESEPRKRRGIEKVDGKNIFEI
jgi:hypothetical protein